MSVEPSAVIRDPSTAGRDADTTAYESAGMGVEAGTPDRRIRSTAFGWADGVLRADPARPARRRRLGRGHLNGDGKGGDAKSNKPGSETSLTPSSSGARPSSTNSKNDKDSSGSGETSASRMSALPDCTPSAAELTVRSLHNALRTR